MDNKVLVRRLPTPGEYLPAGNWLGDQFFLYVYDGNQGNLWKVTPETTKLDAPLKIALPASFPKNRFILHKLIAGGIFSIEPSSGKIVGHFARSVHYPYRE